MLAGLRHCGSSRKRRTQRTTGFKIREVHSGLEKEGFGGQREQVGRKSDSVDRKGEREKLETEF